MPGSTMLRFVQVLPQVSPNGDFLLRDLPGSGKRIDVLCRDLAACFDWGPNLWPKSNLELIAVIGNSKIVTFRNPQNQLPLGEVRWASVIRDALKGQLPEYVALSDGTFEDVIRNLNKIEDSTLWVLDEEGSSLSETKRLSPSTQNSFMLGDHKGFDSLTVSVMSEYNIQRISLGKKSYLSSHCLAAIIFEFERMVR